MKQAEVPLFQQEGTTCCYAKADKFWVRDGDGIPWEMYALLEDVRGRDGRGPSAPRVPRPGGGGVGGGRRCSGTRGWLLRANGTPELERPPRERREMGR